ncbi:MAG: HU family DNA-binding protein [Actinomycetota bacterium]
MNRRDLVRAVAAHAGMEPRDVDQVLKSATDVITAVVAKGEAVSIPGFAKFVKQERPARMGRNPATGQQIRIKASKKAKITPLKGFKDAVMSPSKAPKLPRGIWPLPAAAPAGGAKKAATPMKAKKAAPEAKPAPKAKAAMPMKARAPKTAAKTTSSKKR